MADSIPEWKLCFDRAVFETEERQRLMLIHNAIAACISALVLLPRGKIVSDGRVIRLALDDLRILRVAWLANRP